MMIWLAIPLTVLCYLLTRKLARKVKSPLVNTILLPALAIIALLLLTGQDPADYQAGMRPLSLLLELAVVAFALPLYQQAAKIRRQLGPILLCCSLSVLISVCTTLLIGALVQAQPQLLASIATKSITTPLAMSVSQSMGGIPAIAAGLVIIVGMMGAMIGFPLLRLAGIHHPEAQGLAMGASAHAIGTGAAAEVGTVQGAFASLAMVVCGIATAVLAPPLFHLYLWLMY
ncbi:LrgB family protein [Oceanisphaera psychrotolerans]|uniref:CidB/LrgB family autolysis modulator n=1 Tax=Oceanisphaera psychrotolerans TaxID=1414654 RepID=A0A1J4QCW0_9GAMM|nr:LrgB family protein [Oceanisphaera psychrotolerans]OIN04517.1 CidB/LrgB family autolysis modulator [Oceanisphaera psychrotolerans]